MALVLIEGFDHLTAAQLALKGWGVTAGVSSQSGRLGGQSVRTSNSTVSKTLPGSYSTVYVGFAIKVVNFDITFIQGITNLRNGGTDVIRLKYGSASGNTVWAIYRGDGTTLLGTGTFPITVNIWYYVEMKVVFSATVGSVELRINGSATPDILVTGLNTGTTNVNAIALQGGYGGYSDHDDVYVCDTSGSAPTNNFLGDIRVQAIWPTGNGNSSSLVGSDSNSTDNYLLVDETTPDDNTTYVQSPTGTAKDTYVYGDLTPTSGTVYGIQIVPYAQKTDAGAKGIVSVARLSTTEVDSSAHALSTSYQFFPDISETKPGGGAWTIDDVNNAEFGVKVSA